MHAKRGRPVAGDALPHPGEEGARRLGLVLDRDDDEAGRRQTRHRLRFGDDVAGRAIVRPWGRKDRRSPATQRQLGKGKMAAGAPDEKRLKRMEAILLSMTAKERRLPQLLDGSRRRRIATGSGTTPAEVNSLLGQYDMIRKMMRKGGGTGKKMGRMGGFPGGGLPGGGGFPGMPPGFPR